MAPGRMERLLKVAWPRPENFFSMVGAHLTLQREQVLGKLAKAGARPVDLGSELEVQKAVALWLLWKTLSNPSRMSLIVGDESARFTTMQYLKAICGTVTELYDCCTFDLGLDMITFGMDRKWRIVARSNRSTHQLLGLRGIPILATVLFDAGSQKAVEIEKELKESGTPLVRLFDAPVR